MTTAGQPPAVPMTGLILLGGVAALLIYREPTALYGTATVLVLACLALLVAAFVARREPPRMEAPDRDRLEVWIRDAVTAGTPEAARSLLLRIGRWPHRLHELDSASRERVARLVDETGTADLLEASTGSETPSSQRVEALHLLSWLRLRDAEPLLIDRLRDPDTDVAAAAAGALARYSSDTALDPLLSAFGHAALPSSRLATLLEDADPGALIDAVARHAASDDPERRFWVAYLAGRTDDDRALSVLLDLSRDPNVDVRANAAESLGRLGREAARSRLDGLLDDGSWVVRAHAARALGALGPEPSADGLIRLLHDSDWWVRENAVLALEKLDPARAFRLLPVLAALQGTARTALEDVLTNLRALPDEATVVASPEGRP